MIAGWRQSLFGRLLVSQLLLTLIVAIALPAVILTTLRRTADDQLERQLRRDADVIQAVLARGPPPDPAAAATVLGPLYARRLGSRAYRVTAADGHVLAQGGATAALPPPPRQPGGGRRLRAIGKLDVYRRTIAGAAGPVVITIAQDRTRPEAIVDDVVAAFVRRTVWLIPLILAVSTLVGLVTVRRVSRQLRDASRQADAIGAPDFAQRVEVARLPREAQGLAAAANRAVDRVLSDYRRQAEFVSSVAHELRTPMALATLRCDALPASPERDALRAALDQAARVIAQLMELAMVEGRAPEIGPIVPAAVAREAVAASAPLVFRSGRSVELDEARAGDGAVPGNAGLLGIAIANLIDNAVRHTPRGTHILVEVLAGGVRVRDDGPGMPPAVTAERRSEGAGLGLAIVARIMAAMGGTMRIEPAAAGAAVTLLLADG